MRVELIHSRGFGRRERIVINGLPVMIGAGADVGIRLNDRHVSHVHCLLAEHEQQVLVRDLNSRHGTFVNGVRVKESPLLPGDSLTVGRSHFTVAATNGTPSVSGAPNGGILSIVNDCP